MDKKVTGIVAYLSWIGLIIAFCAGDKEGAKFHLNQALVIMLFSLLSMVPLIGWIWGIFMIVCWFMGLIAAINDPITCQKLTKCNIGDTVHINLGMNIDKLTNSASIDVKVKYKGHQEGTFMYGEHGNYGPLVTVEVISAPIDIVITDNNHSFVEKHQIFACGVDWDDYDIIIVKQGYIHPEEKAKGKLCIMSLTDGATPQDTRLIDFKLIMRPMFPIDEI